MFQASSLPLLIRAITAPTREVSHWYGDVIETRSMEHRQVGCVLWELRQVLCNGEAFYVDILAHEISEDASGWNAVTYREYPTMPHVDCPEAWLEHSVCFEWRGRVMDHHTAEHQRTVGRRAS